MLRFIISLLLITAALSQAGCDSGMSYKAQDNNSDSSTTDKTDQNVSEDEPPTTDEASIAGEGYLQLELKINDEPVITDSAKFVVHDIDGLRLETWGQRLQSGPYAYTYTFEMRLHKFRGPGTYVITNEYGFLFWQYKSFYVQAENPGSFVADNWSNDRISGEFHFVADDGYGDKRRVDGRFFQR